MSARASPSLATSVFAYVSPALGAGGGASAVSVWGFTSLLPCRMYVRCVQVTRGASECGHTGSHRAYFSTLYFLPTPSCTRTPHPPTQQEHAPHTHLPPNQLCWCVLNELVAQCSMWPLRTICIMVMCLSNGIRSSIPDVHATPPVIGVLQERGLTKREAVAVEHRHRRRNGAPLLHGELAATLHALDSLPRTLLPGQLAELLRTTPMDALRVSCAASPEGIWCSYKRRLCDCGGVVALAEEEVPPTVLSIDCEFKPLRCAAVDEGGRVRFDRIVLPDVPPAGTSTRPLPSILRCDRPSLVTTTSSALRAELEQRMAAGTVLIAHTPASDLRALGMGVEEVGRLLQAGHVIDVATIGLAAGDQVASLKRMAEEDGVAPPGFQAGGGKHCVRILKRDLGTTCTQAQPHLHVQCLCSSRCVQAVQDALVTLAVYRARSRARDASSTSTSCP